MEILIKSYHNTNYVWKPAEVEGGCYYVTDEQFGRERIAQINIMSVKDDPRVGHVICRYCGAMIENNPEAIERHYAEQEAKRDCLTCDHLTTYGNAYNHQSTYTKNDDGTYHISRSFDSKLGCDYDYWTRDIHSEEAKRNCKHFRCRLCGVESHKDIFVSYPEPFLRQLTVDALNQKKYQFVECNNNHFEYDMKLRGSLTAMVNDLGIVDHFIFNNRGWSYKLYYSDKYNKLFYSDRNQYKPNVTDIMTEAKAKQILNKISALYEEGNTNE